jgi:hypothetical protein
MDESKKLAEGRPARKVESPEDAAPAASAPPEQPAASTNAAGEPGSPSTLTPAQQRHLRSHLGEDALLARLFDAGEAVPYQPLNIVLQNVRANSKVFVTIRDDQAAMWSEGDGKGLVGLSFSTTVDPALYLSNFLINAREFYVQTYNESQEIVVQLYVRTAQHDLRGRVDLPPGAVATLQSRSDRTSVVGLSAFAIDF